MEKIDLMSSLFTRYSHKYLAAFTRRSIRTALLVAENTLLQGAFHLNTFDSLPAVRCWLTIVNSVFGVGEKQFCAVLQVIWQFIHCGDASWCVLSLFCFGSTFDFMLWIASQPRVFQTEK